MRHPRRRFAVRARHSPTARTLPRRIDSRTVPTRKRHRSGARQTVYRVRSRSHPRTLPDGTPFTRIRSRGERDRTRRTAVRVFAVGVYRGPELRRISKYLIGAEEKKCRLQNPLLGFCIKFGRNTNKRACSVRISDSTVYRERGSDPVDHHPRKFAAGIGSLTRARDFGSSHIPFSMVTKSILDFLDL